MSGLYYEQFHVGLEFKHELARTMTESDNMLFCGMTLNNQPLHIANDVAAQTEFGKPLVNSILTLGLLIGLTVNDTTLGTTIANLAFRDVTFPKPVFYGDTIRAFTRVIGMRESKSRPEVGIVEFEHIATKQTGEIVCRCERSAMMKKQGT